MSGPSVESPIAWRVCVQPADGRPFDREFRPKARYTTFPTREEAEAEKQRQREWFGERAVVHLQPVFPTPAKRARDRRALQNSLSAAGWPIQMCPPRPGVPTKRARKT